MKFIAAFITAILLSFAADAQRPLVLEFQVEFPEGVEAQYEQVKVFAVVDKQQHTYNLSKKGKIGFRCYPQNSYQIAFAMEGYVTKTIAVDLDSLNFNMRKRDLNFRDLVLEMEPRDPNQDFKVYSQPNATFQYVEEYLEEEGVYEIGIDIIEDSSFILIEPQKHAEAKEDILENVDMLCYVGLKYTRPLKKLRIKQNQMSVNPEYRAKLTEI